MPDLHPDPGAASGEGLRLSVAQQKAIHAIAQGRPVAGNDDGWVEPHCSRPTLKALEKMRLVERSGYDAQGVLCGAGLVRLSPAARAWVEDRVRSRGEA